MSLKDQIIADIQKNGPMPLNEYMRRCNEHYYATRVPFGKAGDFITAPDISQMFGELVGMWCADIWQRAGSPNPFRLIELGPGRGTLMADALRATKNIPGFHAALSVHFVEISPVLRAQQESRVPGAVWHQSWVQTPLEGGPAIFIANEFFDALDIEQWVKHGSSWKRRCVSLSDDKFVFTDVEADGTSNAFIDMPDDIKDAPEGSVFEYCDTGIWSAVELPVRLNIIGGGALLVIDYGHGKSSCGDTLQAMKSHATHDILEHPGEADLTAHVDFGLMREIQDESVNTVHGPTTQGQFLRKLGLDARAAMLARANPARAEDFFADAARLADSDQMGTLFKVMAITSKNWPTPAGFES
jgi:NADH dehydrogenase [ubiquinone] 1 alpha subcomplex assembly factor 7